MLVYAILTITLALLFYTVGVWSAQIQRTIRGWHLILFWAGLACDSTGTALMGRIAGDVLALSVHSITGIAAVFLMLVHALWATAVFARKNDRAKADFHRFSLAVWILWLIAYVSGAVYGILLMS